ncbi:hypothetical protein MLD38_025021 [Melastoma candidum]|uniref:Uncharacterized protein n=1 Tax=Melastoma candidum TaxID=119954 RepID=A0ACB9NZ79_9MYRT|nr:hypothetical protein MLD38_025021 [Melastoma candidum]
MQRVLISRKGLRLCGFFSDISSNISSATGSSSSVLFPRWLSGRGHVAAPRIAEFGGLSRGHSSVVRPRGDIWGVPLVPLSVRRVGTNLGSNSGVGFYRARFPGGSSQFNGFDSYRSSWRSWFRRLTNTDVVLGLIIANVAVFLLWRVADPTFMFRNFTISVENFWSGRVHTLITSAFSHMSMEHIVTNMIGLYFFGNNIVRVFGTDFLLKLYLAGAVGGSIFYLVHHALLPKGHGLFSVDPSRTPGLGASGAVNAIMLLDIFLFPKATLYFDFIIPVPAILLGIFIIGKDVKRIIEGDREISGSAHLGGAAVAAIAWLRLRRGRLL